MFIDPKILDRLRYIKNLDFEFVFCYTNSTLLHKFDINEILNSGLTEMHISIAPLIEEIYTKIYVNKKYKQLLENLRNLLKTFNESREKTVKKIWIEFRSDRPLSECLLTPDYLEYISPYVTNDIIIVALTKFDSMNGTIKEEDLLPGMEIENDETSNMSFFPCANSSSIVIKSTGDVKICGCRYLIEGHDDEFLLGHIKNNTIIELYNSDIVRKMKIKFILNGQLGLCRKCTGYGVYLFQFAQRLS
jgi:MoaA/NifB/PqqE/SkfB family radical SAM enzyme